MTLVEATIAALRGLQAMRRLDLEDRMDGLGLDAVLGAAEADLPPASPLSCAAVSC